jgi:hypothetical protein
MASGPDKHQRGDRRWNETINDGNSYGGDEKEKYSKPYDFKQLAYKRFFHCHAGGDHI